MNLEFKECGICNAKPGSPALCESCLSNRKTISDLHRMISELKSWQDQPTKDGYWLMFDVWMTNPNLVTVVSYGQREQTITITATGREIKRQGMINNAKWYGPIPMPEGD